MSEEMIFLSPCQEKTMALIHQGRNVLVTGAAGTGKSTILKMVKEELEWDFPVTASTGIAAINVSGVTINSWAGLGLGTDSAEDIIQKHKDWRGKAYKRMRKAKRLAIDEVSMIHGSLLDLLDEVLKGVRENNLPFGGLQLILFGDFLQLPPVNKGREKQEFAFQSRSWKEARIAVSMLKHVFRQEDRKFSSALNQIRVGNITPEVKAMLRSRYRQPDPEPSIEPVTVYTHNEDVDLLNARRLADIKGEEWKRTAVDWAETESAGNQLDKNCLAPKNLILKVGAQVMLLWNLDTYAGLANGSIGTVKEISPNKLPVVKFRCGVTREIESQSWEMKNGGDTVASRAQVPLRLAWAITAHKSQGMTLDKIAVHLERAFEYGQSYVALSRARTLEGLFIESTAEGCIKAHPEAVRFYEECGA